jgi:hypothetical protein
LEKDKGDEMKEITLPSGKKAKITPSSFADSKAVYQALIKELRNIEINPKDEVNVNFIKGLFCSLITSDEIEATVLKCAERVEYAGERVVNTDIFDSEDGKMDYFPLMREVAMVNIAPFTKSLFAEFENLGGLVEKLDSLK